MQSELEQLVFDDGLKGIDAKILVYVLQECIKNKDLSGTKVTERHLENLLEKHGRSKNELWEKTNFLIREGYLTERGSTSYMVDGKTKSYNNFYLGQNGIKLGNKYLERHREIVGVK